MHVLKTLNGEQNSDQGQQVDQIDQSKISAFGKLYSAILLSPGDVISLPKLTIKGLFRPAVNGVSGRQLMLKVTFLYILLITTKVQCSFVSKHKCSTLIATVCCKYHKKPEHKYDLLLLFLIS